MDDVRSPAWSPGRATPPRPAGILFDFGDTLLHEDLFDVLAGVEAVLAKATRPPSHTAEELAAALSDLLADLEPRRHVSWLEFPPYMTERLIYEPRGIHFDESAEELEWVFWRAATRWTPEPGVEGVLTAVRDAGLPCGVVSNTAFRGQTLARQLVASGLEDTVSWVMASADHVVRKPHPLLFELASRRLGTRPEGTWFVGDSFECDVEGAAAAGLVPVWYRPGGDVPEDPAPAAAVVSSWREFRRLLEGSGR